MTYRTGYVSFSVGIYLTLTNSTKRAVLGPTERPNQTLDATRCVPETVSAGTAKQWQRYTGFLSAYLSRVWSYPLSADSAGLLGLVGERR